MEDKGRARERKKGKTTKGHVGYLDFGKKVDPDTFGLQTSRFLHPDTKVLHVCIDDILHCSAKWKQKGTTL